MIRLRPPGDKSITHRVLLLAPLASDASRVEGLLVARDTLATAAAIRALGVPLPPLTEKSLRIPGGTSLHAPDAPLDCQNSGTLARLLPGLLVGLGIGGRIDGDRSLRSRPMDRVVYPLQAMGARISYPGRAGRLPLEVAPRASGSLRPLRHRLRVASAQVKSCLLLAGLTGRVRLEVWEPGPSRDHTERLLTEMGVPLLVEPAGEGGVRVAFDPSEWEGPLRPLDLQVPGDPSSAAFLAVAALLAGESLRLERVCLNPTRTAFLEVLAEAGARVRTEGVGTVGGEPVGDVVVEPGEAVAFEVDSDRVPRLIDEIPALAVFAARARGRTRIRGAGELRVKESDRLRLLARNLGCLGVPCRELADGLEIEGTDRRLQGEIETGGDHRIAMAFAVLACARGVELRLDDAECVAVSYPSFWRDLRRVDESLAGLSGGIQAGPEESP